MTRLSAKTLSVLAVVAALALAGCGGDDDSTTIASGGTTTQQGSEAGGAKKTTPGQNGGGKGGGEKQDGSDSGGGSQGTTPKEPTGPAPTAGGSLPNEGSRAVAPGVPLARGGDNSIQTFGVEAPSADRVEASRVLQAYLEARAAGSWAEACSYLSGAIKTQLQQFGGGSQGGAPPDCTEVMRGFTEGVPKDILRIAADIRVLSMRVEGGQAFLLYMDGEDTPSMIPMHRDGSAWQVSAIAGSALVV